SPSPREPRLDHVALWVAGRDVIARFSYEHLGMHEIERTERFTLIGSEARHGKLTLFAAEGPREPGALVHVALRVSRLPEGEVFHDVAEGLRVGLVEAPTDIEYDLDHVALQVPDPEASAAAWCRLGF